MTATPESTTEIHPEDQFQKRCLYVGVAALALCALSAVLGMILNPSSDSFLGWMFNRTQFFRSYLYASQCWMGVSLGSLAILLIHHLTGGSWGISIRRILEASTRVFPWMALLFLPMFLGLSDVYWWAQWTPKQIELSKLYQHKRQYLNEPFFIARTIFYFAIWLLLIWRLDKRSREQDENNTPELEGKLKRISAPGLLVHALLITFASLDWVMSLEPLWFSTIYGLLYGIAQILSAFAFSIFVLVLLVEQPPLNDIIKRQHVRDVGTFLLAFVMIWAYLAFSQFMLIWSGNLKEEIPYYLRRLNEGWQYVGLFLVLFHFVLPFMLLLSRDARGSGKTLTRITLLVFVAGLIDFFWMIAPGFGENSLDHSTGNVGKGLRIHWMDLAAVIGFGGIWLSLFMRELRKRSLVPIEKDNLGEEEHHG